MSATPWTRLRGRIDRYEAKSNARVDELGWRSCENIRHLQTLQAAIRDEIDREIIRARDQGATWTMIPFGSSKQASQQRHAAALRRVKRH